MNDTVNDFGKGANGRERGVNDAVNETVNGRVNTAERLGWWTKVLLVVLVVIPFAISFGALSDLANDLAVKWSWLYPIMIDGGIVIFKLLAAEAALRGERNWFAWGMAFVLTFVSIGLNIAHVALSGNAGTQENFALAAFMHGLPPAMVFLAFFAVVMRIESESAVDGATLSLASITQKIAEAGRELATAVADKKAAVEAAVEASATMTTARESAAKLKEALAKYEETVNGRMAELAAEEAAVTTRLEAARAELETVKAQVVARATKTEPTAVASNDRLDAMLAYMRSNPDAAQADVARELDVSKAWVSKSVKALTEEGQLHKNGHGWEVRV